MLFNNNKLLYYNCIAFTKLIRNYITLTLYFYFIKGIMGPKIVFSDAVRKDIAVNFDLHGKIHTQCKNGHIIHSFNNHGESISNTL
jgi:hypothetical protein